MTVWHINKIITWWHALFVQIILAHVTVYYKKEMYTESNEIQSYSENWGSGQGVRNTLSFNLMNYIFIVTS